VETVPFHLPLNLSLRVARNERHQGGAVTDHEHLLHVGQRQGVVRLLSTAGNLESNRIHKFVNEEMVGLKRDVLLLGQDFLVGALNKVSLK
jgi:hypothetical protein